MEAESDGLPVCCRSGGFQFNAGQFFLRGAGGKALAELIVATQLRFHEMRGLRPELVCGSSQPALQWSLFKHCGLSPSRCKMLDPRLFRDAFSAENLPTDTHHFSVHMDDDDKKQLLLRYMRRSSDNCSTFD